MTNRCLPISISAQFTGELGKASLSGPNFDSLNGARVPAAIRAVRGGNTSLVQQRHDNAFTSLASLEPPTTVSGHTSNSRCRQMLSGASSQPWTSAGGAVASTAVNASIIVYWCIAPARTLGGEAFTPLLEESAP